MELKRGGKDDVFTNIGSFIVLCALYKMWFTGLYTGVGFQLLDKIVPCHASYKVRLVKFSA